ncbi:MAG TPA: cobalt ECF transporter T component CbiQ [Firmicutes bacterium]|nr:cobalt ECF transporter T component CbiQ [Bacillota bacterium]
MIMIDKLCYSSKLRYQSPFLKMGFSIGLLFLCVISRSIVVSLCILLLMGSLTVIRGGTSFKRYRHFMFVPLAFLLLSTVAIMVNLSPEPLSLVAIPVGRSYLTVSWAGFIQCVNLILTALAAVSCLYFLTLTTPLTDILLVLRKCKCPYLVIELMMLIYRFIFILFELASSLYHSQACRLGHKDLKTSWNSMGKLMAVLLVRAMQKSNRLFDAMESRCYNGTILVLEEHQAAAKKEIVAACVTVAILIGVAVICSYFGI